MLIDNQLWYARVTLYNVNNNYRFLLRTRHNATKIFYHFLNWDAVFPADTGRKMNVHKTFRRRPGHFLNR